MVSILLIDGNNLGHALGYMDKATGHYDSAGLLECLDAVSRYLTAQGHEIETVLFLDDVSAAERLGGWHVQIAPVPGGDADAAIRAYAQAHAERQQILISADQALCGDVAMWGVVCLPPSAFVSRYLIPAQHAGFFRGETGTNAELFSGSIEAAAEKSSTAPILFPHAVDDQGEAERLLQIATLERAEATLRGEPFVPPEVYKLELSRWSDAAELALYLAENHLCPGHSDLTDPNEMIAAICEHCSQQPRYFTSGRVINRAFRVFLCRPEHTLSLGDLARLTQTRRRKVKAALQKYGERLGIVMVW
jgi:hypothetical protein